VRTTGQEFAPHRDIYHFLLRRSWAVFFGLFLVVFLAANTLFATIFMLEPQSIANARPGSFEDAFFFSVQTLATIGYGGMSPASRYGHITVTIEAFFGVLMTALVTGLCFAKFSRPTARVLFSKNMVTAPRNGVPHLMFRMANQRHNQVHEASVSLTLLLTETTQEGESLRRPHELKLERSRNQVFTYTWLVMHKIDETSPFYGSGSIARLEKEDGQIFVVVSGLDETVGQVITARWSYGPEDIVYNAKFADVLSLSPEGIRQIDYHVFHDIVPLGRGEDDVRAGSDAREGREPRALPDDTGDRDRPATTSAEVEVGALATLSPVATLPSRPAGQT